jgi:hypothetical protein
MKDLPPGVKEMNDNMRMPPAGSQVRACVRACEQQGWGGVGWGCGVVCGCNFGVVWQGHLVGCVVARKWGARHHPLGAALPGHIPPLRNPACLPCRPALPCPAL